MSRYATGTDVSAARSRAEIERIVVRYGADGFVCGWDGGNAQIMFRAHGRFVRFTVKEPELEEFAKTPTGRSRDMKAQRKEQAKETSRRWRVLALVIKAKLEAVESGVVTFEDEFLAQTVLPDSSTVGDWVRAKVEGAYKSGKMPKLLVAPGG